MADRSSDSRQGGFRRPAGLVGLPRDTASILGGIIVVAVALRVMSALLQGDTVTVLPGIDDQVSYHALAVRVLGGHGFTFATNWWPNTLAGQPTAQWSFLYTLYLAGVYALVGVHPLVARLLQAIAAGVLYPWLAWRIGDRVFGKRVGLIAAALSAIYIYFVYYAGALMTETFYILAILWAFDLVTALAQPRTSASGPVVATRKTWLLLGLALGTATLLRQLITFFVPVVFVWLLVVLHRKAVTEPSGSGDYSWRSSVVGLLLTTSVIAAMILPWTIRNYVAFHQFVPLNTNAGYVFFWANNPVYGTHFVPILSDQEYEALIPANLRGLDEATLSQDLLEKGIQFVLADPGRYALLSLSRIPVYFEFWPSADSGLVSNLSRVFSFGILLPFMLLGLFISVRRWRRMPDSQRSSIALLYLFIIVYSLIHILSWTLIRYRLPVDAILILFAADAIDAIAASFGAARSLGPFSPEPLPGRVTRVDRLRPERVGHSVESGAAGRRKDH